eukprot:TRINITY_DN4766_c0_g1_i1.p1 TRINITY_DN4766_c0_g1~~TRINITY_DN4766_c0_g1_i1.p1  ORF type:complete len:714 (+),score=160.15 TRINITY_DN4766_c0_g1_i1:64-2205(+)
MGIDYCNYLALDARAGKAAYARALGLQSQQSANEDLPSRLATRILRDLARSSRAGVAIACLRTMRAYRLEVNAFHYSAVISACEKGERWETACFLLDEMSRLSVQRDAIVVNAAISACEKGARWEFACGLLGEMPRRSVTPTTVSFNAAISACEKGSAWHVACQLFSAMRSTCISRDTVTYNATISAYAAGQRWRAALALGAQMVTARVSQSLVTHNALISACEKGGRWELALHLLEQASLLSNLQPDAVSYGASVLACAGARRWSHMLGLLKAMAESAVEPNSTTRGRILAECEHRALPEQAAELLEGAGRTEGRGKREAALGTVLANAAALGLVAASRFGEARRRLRAAVARGEADELSARLLTAAGGTVGAELPAVPPPALGSPYAKELRLYAHVLATAPRGDAAAVLAAIELYSRSVAWLKVAGGRKAEVLLATLRAASPAASSSDDGLGVDGGVGRRARMLEIGTYCGYSAILVASGLADGCLQVDTLELDPVHVAIARCLIAHASLDGAIRVWMGHSRETLPRLAQREPVPYDVVFVDGRGSGFEEDLELLERGGLLREGTVIIADNVLKPGAPLFLWQVMTGGAFATQVVNVGEFATDAADWMAIAVRCRGAAEAPQRQPAPKAEAPADVVKLSREADRLRRRSMRGERGVSQAEWAKFAEASRRRLARLGVAASADAAVDWEDRREGRRGVGQAAALRPPRSAGL